MKKRKINDLTLSIVIGIVVCTVITLMGLYLLAWMISSEKLEEKEASCGIAIVLIAATTIGVIIAAMITNDKKAISALATGGGYFIFLLIITALFFGAKYQGVWETALAIFGSTAAVILMYLTKGKRKNKHRIKIRNR